MQSSVQTTGAGTTYRGIRDDLGDLGDLPRELATTVANVYYRVFAFPEDPAAVMTRDCQSLDEDNFIEKYRSFREGVATAQSSFHFAKHLIQSTRGARDENPAVFDYLVTLTLDILKYNIDKAHEKTPIRRAIERKFKKVDEISNLLDIMAARGMVIYSPNPQTTTRLSPQRIGSLQASRVAGNETESTLEPSHRRRASSTLPPNTTPLQKNEGSFFCPECGSRNQGDITYVGFGLVKLRPEFKEASLEELRKDPWFGVQQIVHCGDCGVALPAHIAKLWGDKSEAAATEEWRARYRDHKPPTHA